MQIDDNADSWLTCIACCILIKLKQYGIMQALKSTTHFNRVNIHGAYGAKKSYS